MKHRFKGSCGHGYIPDECDECPEYEDCKELMPFEDDGYETYLQTELDIILAERDEANSSNELLL